MNEAEQNTQRIMTELLSAHAQTKRMLAENDGLLQRAAELDKIIGEQRMRIGALELDNAFIRAALMKIATSTQQAYDYDRIGSGEFDDKYPEYQEPDPEKMFMNAAIQANETARGALEVK